MFMTTYLFVTATVEHKFHILFFHKCIVLITYTSFTCITQESDKNTSKNTHKKSLKLMTKKLPGAFTFILCPPSTLICTKSCIGKDEFMFTNIIILLHIIKHLQHNWELDFLAATQNKIL